jgi:hypothetical protein
VMLRPIAVLGVLDLGPTLSHCGPGVLLSFMSLVAASFAVAIPPIRGVLNAPTR